MGGCLNASQIPVVPVEVTLAPDSTPASWDAGDGAAAFTAMPKFQLDDLVRKGLIKLTT